MNKAESTEQLEEEVLSVLNICSESESPLLLSAQPFLIHFSQSDCVSAVAGGVGPQPCWHGRYKQNRYAVVDWWWWWWNGIEGCLLDNGGVCVCVICDVTASHLTDPEYCWLAGWWSLLELS